MATGGFLYQFMASAAVLAALVVLFVVVKALWAEIGPMLALLFRRDRLIALQEDDDIELKP
jgi:hypothetical protein